MNPWTPEDVAAGVARALAMSPDERRVRHRALLARVRRQNVTSWSERFIKDLDRSRTPRRAAAATLQPVSEMT